VNALVHRKRLLSGIALLPGDPVVRTRCEDDAMTVLGAVFMPGFVPERLYEWTPPLVIPRPSAAVD
jgi:hypothetical protein